MSTSASLPMPVAARVAPSRTVAHAWAAPRAADIVLDPWAAPVGPPIAALLLSPWPAPNPNMRIVSMPPPTALMQLPDLSDTTDALARSTDAAIAALGNARSATLLDASPLPPPTIAPDATVVAETSSSTPDSVGTDRASTTRLRARMWAMIAGGAAAAAGIVTLIATAL